MVYPNHVMQPLKDKHKCTGQVRCSWYIVKFQKEEESLPPAKKSKIVKWKNEGIRDTDALNLNLIWVYT